MASHRLHRLFTRLLLGRDYGWLHREVDRPYRLLGPRHRILYHDGLTTLYYLIRYGPDEALAHLTHLLLDRGRRLSRLLELLSSALG